MAEPKVHLLHHRLHAYRHTYCGFVNYAKKKPWLFTKKIDEVTCLRCIDIIDADGGKAVAFTIKLKEWEDKLKKQAERLKKKASEGK